jgi:hypothetical protein
LCTTKQGGRAAVNGDNAKNNGDAAKDFDQSVGLHGFLEISQISRLPKISYLQDDVEQ